MLDQAVNEMQNDLVKLRQASAQVSRLWGCIDAIQCTFIVLCLYYCYCSVVRLITHCSAANLIIGMTIGHCLTKTARGQVQPSKRHSRSVVQKGAAGTGER